MCLKKLKEASGSISEGRRGVLSEKTQANEGRRGGRVFSVVWLRKKEVEEKVLEARLKICI